MRRLALVGLVLILAGCVPAPAASPSSPTPTTSAPVFASEEEALAAAEQAYAAYLALADTIGQEGGTNPERLASVVTPDWLDTEVQTFNDIRSRGWRQEGSTALVDLRLQQLDDVGGAAEVVTYACVDFSGSRYTDASGVSVTPEARPDVVGLQVTFTASREAVLISGSEPWQDLPC